MCNAVPVAREMALPLFFYQITIIWYKSGITGLLVGNVLFVAV